MGTLSPPFILCPLSDRKELLGMAEDRLQNKAVITIGRNIAIRYHILEQKQETSWTISRHWLTSRVIFCSEIDRYAAVWDNTIIALWEEGDTALDKVFKSKFADPIFELKSTRLLETLVIFENGFIIPLREATTEKNKNIARNRGIVDTDSEVIIDCDVDEERNQVVLIVANKTKDKKNQRHIQLRKVLKIFLLQLGKNDGQKLKNNKVLHKLDISLEGKDICGHCVVSEVDENPAIVYVCSDGKVYQQELKTGDTEISLPEPQIVGQISKYVSTKTALVLKYISSSIFIIYGSCPSLEGGVVFLYDLKYDLVVSKQSLKLYGTPPIMESIGGNVIIPVGLHILVLAFRASKSLLSSVVGKHGIRSGEEVFEERAPFKFSSEAVKDWEVDKDVVVMNQNQFKKIKKEAELKEKKELAIIHKKFPTFWEVVKQFKILEGEGQPEALICNQIIPLVLDSNNLDALDWILNTFTDIPEKYLITILSHLLNQLENPSLALTPRNGTDDKDTAGKTYPSSSRINCLLNRSFDTRELIRNLPLMDFPQVKKFLVYLKSRMEFELDLGSNRDNNDPGNALSLSQIVKWMTSGLDAHYTKFVFNNELQLVEELLSVIEEGNKLMEAIDSLAPYLLMTYNKVDFTRRQNPSNKWRTEIVTFV